MDTYYYMPEQNRLDRQDAPTAPATGMIWSAAILARAQVLIYWAVIVYLKVSGSS